MKLPYFLIIVTAISILCQFPAIQDYVYWNSALIQQGEWWRILSGNFTHTNVMHLVMNIAALWILGFLFRPSAKNFTNIILLTSIFIGFGLLLTDLPAYAGLSGVLHGVFSFYALSEALRGRKSSWLLVAGVIVKIGYEQFYGASESTVQLIEADVAIDAHLIGGTIGLLLAVLLLGYFNKKADKI